MKATYTGEQCPVFDYNDQQCENYIKSGNICETHKYRQKHGIDMQKPVSYCRDRHMTNREMIDHIYDNCEEAYNCLIWQGARNEGGNPQISFRGKTHGVQKLLFQLTFNVKLENDDFLKRTCNNQLCCNLDHCVVATKSECNEMRYEN